MPWFSWGYFGVLIGLLRNCLSSSFYVNRIKHLYREGGLGLLFYVWAFIFTFHLYIPLLPPPSWRSIPRLASITTGQTDVPILRPLSHVVWDRQCASQVLSLKASVNVVIETSYMGSKLLQVCLLLDQISTNELFWGFELVSFCVFKRDG